MPLSVGLASGEMPEFLINELPSRPLKKGHFFESGLTEK
jgi:hypothetical protein